jgi:hypothetical protein
VVPVDPIPQSESPGGTAPPEPKPLAAGGLGVVPILLRSPSKAFRRLSQDPKWVGTFVLVILLGALAAWIQLPQTVEYSREQMQREMEKQGMEEEEIAGQVGFVTSPAFLFASGVVGSAIFLFLMAALLHVVIKLAGPSGTFRHSSAIFWTAALAPLAGALLKAVLVRSSGSVEVSLSPAALFPDLEFGSLPANFLEIFDLFSLLNLWLLVLGVRLVLGTSKGLAWGIGGGFWAVISLARFALATIGSNVSGSA